MTTATQTPRLEENRERGSHSLQRLVGLLRDALLANQIFHTPIALRRRGGEWNEYETDAINRTRDALAATMENANSCASVNCLASRVTFDEFCREYQVTDGERTLLKNYLSVIRVERVMTL